MKKSDKLKICAMFYFILIIVLIIYLSKSITSGNENNSSTKESESTFQTEKNSDAITETNSTKDTYVSDEDLSEITGKETIAEPTTEVQTPAEHTTVSSESNSNGNNSGNPNGAMINNTDSNNGQITPEGTSSTPQQELISLPYTIPGSSLTIQQTASYDGIFLENGNDETVSNVTTLILKNEGSKPIEYANITMKRTDGIILQFEVSDILAGATVVVQELNQNAYQQGSYLSCTADIAEVEKLELSEGSVQVEETDSGALKVSNLTNTEIPCVRIFYKFYMSDENVYVGGITYVAKLTALEADGSQTITPSHYSAGYSKVVMVRTYDTTE